MPCDALYGYDKEYFFLLCVGVLFFLYFCHGHLIYIPHQVRGYGS